MAINKFKKIDREFKLTDSSVNCYDFRLMTSGYQIDEFKKNPIGYNMHDRTSGVLVKWEDFRVEGDEVFAKPVVNLSNPRGQQTVEEIENGFLNGASVGHLVVLEYTNDPSFKLPNQEGPTVTRWYNRECSLVDIPGNFDALALFDENNNQLNLADFSKPKIQNMKQIILSALSLAALSLSTESSETDVQAKITDLVAKASLTDSLSKELSDLKSKVMKDQVNSLLDTALDDGKINVATKDKLAADYALNPEGLKVLVEALPKYVPITENLGASTASDLYKGKDWNKLHEEGLLMSLKAENPTLFKEVFKKEFGIDPKI